MTAKQTSTKGSFPATLSSRMALSGRSSDTGLEIYRYDAFNRLTNYNSGSDEASYTYSAKNLRASKTVNREKTNFVWNGQNLAAESKGEKLNTYAYDITGVHVANQNGTVTSYLKDYHGNVIGKTTKTGAMFNEMGTTTDYDAFGNCWQGDAPDPFGYCGEYLDNESGLIYLRNRYYDTTSGRFITEDPVKDGLNWYSYCAGNPVMLVDPSGLLHVDENGQSTIPRDLDWDRDGRLDTIDDRSRFDSDYNGIADWREYFRDEDPDSILNSKPMPGWYSCRNVKMLDDFPFIWQDPKKYDELCWAIAPIECIWHITGKEISVETMARDRLKYERIEGDDYNKGFTARLAANFINEYGYLKGSGYEIEIKPNSVRFSIDYIKEKINSNTPIVMHMKNHDVAAMGYAYDDELNKAYVLYYDSNYNPIPLCMELKGKGNTIAYSFKKTN